MKGILGLKDALVFGRHKGKTVEEVMLADVGWLCWLGSEELKISKNAFDANVNLLLDNVVRGDKQLHRKFGSDIEKWQSVDNPPQVTVSYAGDTPAPAPARSEGWGAW